MALPVRIAIAVAALLVAAWLAIEALGAHATNQLTTLSFAPGRLTPAEAARGETLVNRAARLNPDRRPELFRGVLRLRAGDVAGAERAFRAVTRAEPENLEAWALIARTAGSYDRALAATARERVRALAPPVKR